MAVGIRKLISFVRSRKLLLQVLQKLVVLRGWSVYTFSSNSDEISVTRISEFIFIEVTDLRLNKEIDIVSSTCFFVVLQGDWFKNDYAHFGELKNINALAKSQKKLDGDLKMLEFRLKILNEKMKDGKNAESSDVNTQELLNMFESLAEKAKQRQGVHCGNVSLF